jgi:hypothetical protein
MKTLCLLISLVLISLAACEREGPAEKAGEAVDRAGRDIRDAVKRDK